MDGRTTQTRREQEAAALLQCCNAAMLRFKARPGEPRVPIVQCGARNSHPDSVSLCAALMPNGKGKITGVDTENGTGP